MLIATILLAASLSLLAAFSAFCVAEERVGRRLFAPTRERLDVYATELWQALVMGGVPMRWRQEVLRAAHTAVHTGVHVAVAALRAAERPLARLSYKMRVSAPKGNGKQVSEFLRTITPE